jgi:hypothetical protein
MRSRWLATLIVVLVFFLLSACGGTQESPSTSTPAGSDGGDKNASSGNSDDEPTVEIVDFGFGQSKCCDQGMVVVTTDSEAAIGESVTVTANFLDADGQILATVEQIESFNWVGQELALPLTPYDLDDKAKVASIDPSVALSDYGITEPAKAPLPVLEATEIKKGEFSDYTASFAFTNETDADLENLRVGVVCYNAAQKIVGGTTTYPELAPASKTIRIDADPTVSGKPASCKAFVNYDV